MIVRRLEDAQREGSVVETPTWASRRLLLRRDGCGFSMHDTIIHAGTETLIWYRNHLEAVYCVGGEGEIEVVAEGAAPGSGTVYPISDGTLYALDGRERHYLRATTDMRMVCVFTPPLTGAEVHDADGVYPLLD